MDSMTHQCQRCGIEYTPGRGLSPFCTACRDVLRTRVCAYCGKIFRAQKTTSTQAYCSPACGGIATSQQRTAERGGLPVRCRWVRCSHPDELVPASFGSPYHPECQRDLENNAPLARPKAIAASTICKACGKPIVFTAHRDRPRKFHVACYRGTRRPGRRRTGEERPCAVCGIPVYRHDRAARATKNFICSEAHRLVWLSQHNTKEHLAVRCLGCGHIHTSTETGLPRGVDRVSMTYHCRTCKKPNREIHTAVCAECGKPFTRRIKNFDPAKLYCCNRAHRNAWLSKHHKVQATVIVSCAYCWQEATAGRMDFSEAKFPLPRHRLHYSDKHFHSKSHQSKYYNKKRWSRIACSACGAIFQPRGPANIYCSRRCANGARRGKPIATPRLNAAEQKIAEAWARGIHGVRELTRVCAISRNTVRQILRSGQVVEPAAARSA